MTHNQYRAEKSHIQSHTPRGAAFSNVRTLRRILDRSQDPKEKERDAAALELAKDQVRSQNKFKNRSFIDSALQVMTMRRAS